MSKILAQETLRLIYSEKSSEARNPCLHQCAVPLPVALCGYCFHVLLLSFLYYVDFLLIVFNHFRHSWAVRCVHLLLPEWLWVCSQDDPRARTDRVQAETLRVWQRRPPRLLCVDHHEWTHREKVWCMPMISRSAHLILPREDNSAMSVFHKRH